MGYWLSRWILGLGVSDLKFGVLGLGFRAPGGSVPKMLGIEARSLNPKPLNPQTLNPKTLKP